VKILSQGMSEEDAKKSRKNFEAVANFECHPKYKRPATIKFF